MARLKPRQPTDPAQAASPQSPAPRLAVLQFGQPATVHLRDGEVVVFRRPGSPLWQCRYKLDGGGWHRASTGHATLERAIPAACEAYDYARFRQRLGLAHRGCSFTELAQATLAELRTEMDAGQGKSVHATYITCIEKYFLP